MSNCIKARRASITLGDIPLNVYQMPSGQYVLAGRNVTDAIGERNNSLIRTMGVKSLKALPHADESLIQISAVTGERFDGVSLEDAATYWGLRGLNGNPLAISILTACTIESIERRADRAFGVTRTEEERDQLLKTRMERVRARLGWTDVIKQDQEHRGIYLSDLGNREFADLTRIVNRRLFGVPHFCCDRDNMDMDQQLDITAFERMLMRKHKVGETDLHCTILNCLDFYQDVDHQSPATTERARQLR